MPEPPASRPRFVVLIPDGVAIRNFLFSSFLDQLLERGDVTAWHALSDGVLSTQTADRLERIDWIELPSFREGLLERVLRLGKVHAQLYWQDDDGGSGVVLEQIRPRGRLRTRAVWWSARLLGRLMGTRGGTMRLDRWHRAVAARGRHLAAFERFLAQQGADLVFCTHQRSSRAVPAMIAAARLGIPTATFIYSWDNLPKGRMAVHADHFLVWSEHMEAELERYYPEVGPSRIHVVGTPQFEPYFDDLLLEPRESFLDALGLDPARPVVCFSGCDVPSSPHDPECLADLAAGAGRFAAPERPQILFRPSPADVSGRYDEVLERFPEIAVSRPLWAATRGKDWTQIVPTPEDVALLANVVRHCDLVVNFGSTMAMDFAILDKPAIYPMWEVGADGRPGPVSKAYRLAHFRSVLEIDPVYWARSPAELESLLRRALERPEEKRRERRRWLDLLTTGPLDEASRRCCETLALLAGGTREAA